MRHQSFALCCLVTLLALGVGCPKKPVPTVKPGTSVPSDIPKTIPKGAPVKADGTLDTDALKKLAFIEALRSQPWNGTEFTWGAPLPDDPALKQTPAFNPAWPIMDMAIQPDKFMLPVPKLALDNPPEPPKEGAARKEPPHPRPVQKVIDPTVDWAPMPIPPGPIPFTTKLFSYKSEGLKIGGFGSIPTGTGKFPVIIMIHGYVPAQRYTPDNLRREAEYLSSRGFLVLVPDLRNYGTSDKVDADEEIRRLGYQRDVLNLMADVRGSFVPEGDPGSLGLWGFGHGGDLAIKAAIISGAQGVESVSGTGLQMALDHDVFAKGMAPEAATGMDALYGPPGPETVAWYRAMTASNFLDKLPCPVCLVHGELDPVVPIDRPRGFLAIITPLGIQAQFNSLPYTAHGYFGQDWLSEMTITEQFMRDRLKPVLVH